MWGRRAVRPLWWRSGFAVADVQDNCGSFICRIICLLKEDRWWFGRSRVRLAVGVSDLEAWTGRELRRLDIAGDW